MPNSLQLSPDTLMARAGENFVDAFLDHPELAAGWYPLTETIYHWKLRPEHVGVGNGSVQSPLFRRWRAEYAGPLGLIQFEIRPTGQVACQLFADVDELGRMLALVQASITRPRYEHGLQRVDAHVRPRGDLAARVREEDPCPIEADLVFPGNLQGAATVANILTGFFDEPNPATACPAFNEIRWGIGVYDQRAVVMTITPGE